MQNSGIKWKMIRVLVFGWILPMAIVMILVTVFMSGRIDSQMKETVTNSLSKVASLIESGFEECNKESRNATYLGIVQENYNDYLLSGDKQKLYNDVTVYLSGQYRYNKRTESVMLFFTEDPELFYSTYDSSVSFKDIRNFIELSRDEVLKVSEKLDTAICLYNDPTGLYLVRNLVNASYRPFAVLVMKLEPEEMFGSLKSVWGFSDAFVLADGKCIYGSMREDQRLRNTKENGTACFVSQNGIDYAYYSTEIDGSTLSFQVELDRNLIRGGQRVGVYILLILVISMIPLCFIVFRFFDSMITHPVNELVKAAGEIGSEKYGYEIESKANSREFIFLNNAFNEMSHKLKQQFEQIYLEELAVRDANIKALQSQINPHFINNTLEIINWEARLNGIYKVSGMIEALSTMLNATLNRSNIQTIKLSEEMKYVDAYLYIISERMGKRLTVNKEIDESLLNENVPRLIAQPIVENAVEHGIRDTGSGNITIRIYAAREYMYLEVRNSGRMSEEDKQRIHDILSESEEKSAKTSISIGISNVNKRLKLMYGDSCGLTITEDGDETVSLLTFIREGGERNAR